MIIAFLHMINRPSVDGVIIVYILQFGLNGFACTVIVMSLMSSTETTTIEKSWIKTGHYFKATIPITIIKVTLYFKLVIISKS